MSPVGVSHGLAWAPAPAPMESSPASQRLANRLACVLSPDQYRSFYKRMLNFHVSGKGDDAARERFLYQLRSVCGEHAELIMPLVEESLTDFDVQAMITARLGHGGDGDFQLTAHSLTAGGRTGLSGLERTAANLSENEFNREVCVCVCVCDRSVAA